MNYLKGLLHDYDTYVGILVVILIFLIPAGFIKFAALAAPIYLIAKPNQRKKLTGKIRRKK